MSVGLVSVGGEEGDGGFGCGDDQAPFRRPLRNAFGVGRKGTGGRGDVGAGEGIGKVICIGGGELWGLWVGGGVEIEKAGEIQESRLRLLSDFFAYVRQILGLYSTSCKVYYFSF